MMRGDFAAARTALAQARSHLRPAGLQWFAPILIPLVEAGLTLAEGDAASARDSLAGLVRRVEALPARPFLPEVLRLWAKALAALGETDEALAMLREARETAESAGSAWRLLPVLFDLSGILQSTGDSAGSLEAMREAHRLVNPMLKSLPAGEAWVSFRNRPDVRAALGG
jgi:tetratricopeptide (TPR) repeat protein